MSDHKPAVSLVLAAAAAANDSAEAERAIEPHLEALRRQLHGMSFKGAPRLRTLSPVGVSATESPAMTVERVTRRIEQLHLAKVYGTADDAACLIDDTVAEVRFAALGMAARSL